MNAEIVALRVKLYNVERDLEDSKADYVKLAHLVCDLWHSSAAAYIPPWLQKRVRDVSHAQLAEAQRFPHGAAVTGCDMKINDEGRSNAAYWHERAMKAEARLAEAIECCTIKDNRNLWLEIRLKKIMARCADLLDEDQFNELDAIARPADSAPAVPICDHDFVRKLDQRWLVSFYECEKCGKRSKDGVTETVPVAPEAK